MTDRPRLPLRVLLPLLIGGFTLLTIGLSYALMRPAALRNVEDNAAAALQAELSRSQGVLQTFLRDANEAAVQGAVASLGADPHHALALLADASGRISASTRMDALGKQWSEVAVQIDRSIANRVASRGGIAVRVLPNHDAIAGYASVCAHGGTALRPQQCGFLYYEQQLGARQAAALSVLHAEARYEALGAALLAVALWLILHWRLARPIARMTDVARAFGRGDLAARARLTGSDELSSLGAEFDRMLDQVTRDQENLRMHDRALVASSDGVVFADACSDEQRIISVNRAFEQISGYSAGEVVGRNCRFLQGEDRDQPGLDDLRSALRELRPVTVTLRNFRKDGSAFWNELSIAPVRDDSGAVRHFVGVVRDVTQLADAQNELRQSHERLEQRVVERTEALREEAARREVAERQTRTLLERAPDAMVVVGEAGTIEFANAQVESLLGYAPDELVGEPVERLLPTRLRDGHVAHRAHFADAPRARSMGEGMQLVALAKDGREFPIEVSLSPVDDEQGAAVAASIRDITPREEAARLMREAADIAEHATATKSRFLAAASHDLRQPLQSLGLYLGVLARTDGKGKVEELAGKMRQSVDAMSELLDALLDISKLDSGAVQPELSDFALQSLFDKVSASVEPMARDKGLVFEWLPTEFAVHSDPALLQRIVENLATNAVRYTNSGSVTLVAESAGEQVRINVVDTGIGIDEAAQKQVFEEYFQLDNPVRDRRKGLGLGLAIVKQIAALLDHPLELVSAPGEGSTFSLTVPRAASVAVAAPKPVLLTEATSRVKPLQVLFVDDDPAIVNALSMLLDLEGFHVHTADCMGGAMQQLDEGVSPDVLITDYRLPHESGIAVIARVRERTRAGLPAVLMSGDTVDLNAAHHQVANVDFLRKPVKGDELVALIRQLADAGRAPEEV